jgi:hypothetical protein
LNHGEGGRRNPEEDMQQMNYSVLISGFSEILEGGKWFLNVA